MAALALMALGCGLPGFMLSKVLAPAFYARQDTKTPVRSAVVTVVINILLNLVITGTLWKLAVHGAHAGIALSTALSGLVNAAQLAWYLRRQGHYAPAAGWRKYGLQLGFAGAAMVAELLLVGRHAGDFTVMPTSSRVIWLAVLIGSGALTFGAALLLSGLRPRDVLERHEP
ncbi:MAG: lipid II flippase MurJ [Gemmataceae bacterium]